jgi:hypothetical protein
MEELTPNNYGLLSCRHTSLDTPIQREATEKASWANAEEQGPFKGNW